MTNLQYLDSCIQHIFAKAYITKAAGDPNLTKHVNKYYLQPTNLIVNQNFVSSVKVQGKIKPKGFQETYQLSRRTDK